MHFLYYRLLNGSQISGLYRRRLHWPFQGPSVSSIGLLRYVRHTGTPWKIPKQKSNI